MYKPEYNFFLKSGQIFPEEQYYIGKGESQIGHKEKGHQPIKSFTGSKNN